MRLRTSGAELHAKLTPYSTAVCRFAANTEPPFHVASSYRSTGIRGLAGGFKELHFEKPRDAGPDAEAMGGVLAPGQSAMWPVWVMAGSGCGKQPVRLLVEYTASSSVGSGRASASPMGKREIQWASEVRVQSTR